MLSNLNDPVLFLSPSVPIKDDKKLNSTKLVTYNEVLICYITLSFRENFVGSSKNVTLASQ